MKSFLKLGIKSFDIKLKFPLQRVGFALRGAEGFTLIEILVVTTILGILAVGALVSYQGFGATSRDSRRKGDVEQIRSAIELFRNNNTNGSYPDSAEVTINCSSTGGIEAGGNTYLSKIPLDPKCTTYNYYYAPLPNGCDSSDSANPCIDYTVAAYLEKSTVTACTASAECGVNCNYCMGPFGEK